MLLFAYEVGTRWDRWPCPDVEAPSVRGEVLGIRHRAGCGEGQMVAEWPHLLQVLHRMHYQPMWPGSRQAEQIPGACWQATRMDLGAPTYGCSL